MNTQKTVVVFAGSECIREKEKYYYSLAYETGKLLAESGFITATGGGPGLMDQTMKGAHDQGGKTMGICLALKERRHSEYATTREIFEKLRPRQEKLISLADAFLAVPGGIGTLYEIAEVLTLKRKNEVSQTKPVILIGPYYQEFHQLLQNMETDGFLKVEANTLFQIVDTPKEAISILRRFYGL
jgi:cytokinin riboside 5'-monophosphate phosphoribohydrolase